MNVGRTSWLLLLGVFCALVLLMSTSNAAQGAMIVPTLPLYFLKHQFVRKRGRGDSE